MKSILSSLILLFFITGASSQQAYWTPKADLPVCIYEGVTFATDDMVYFGLGIFCQEGETTNMYALDLSTNTWEQMADFPGPTRRMASAFSINGKGYVCLGFSNGVGLTDLWEYDPASDSWTQKSSFPGGARGAAIADVINGKAYVGTGFGIGGPSLYPLDLWEYDPAADQWTQKASKPGVALYTSRSFTIYDTLYLAGGIGGELLQPINEFWAWSASTDTWVQKENLPGSDDRVYATTFSIGNKGYFGFGMLSPGSYMADFYSYTPSTGQWQFEVTFGIPTLFNGTSSGGTANATHGFAVAGRLPGSPSPPTTSVWQFHPENTVGIKKIDELVNISIHPNPANDRISITSEFSGRIIIKDLLGKEVKAIEAMAGVEQVVDIADLQPGLYLVIHQNSRSGGAVKLIVK